MQADAFFEQGSDISAVSISSSPVRALPTHLGDGEDLVAADHSFRCPGGRSLRWRTGGHRQEVRSGFVADAQSELVDGTWGCDYEEISSRSRLKRGLFFRQGAMLLLEAQPFKRAAQDTDRDFRYNGDTTSEQ